MASEEALIKNIKQYWKYAELAYSNSDFNTSLIMHYKCIISCADLKILRKMDTVPSNHTKRFRILERNFPDVYRILDKHFSDYRDSYVLNIRNRKAKRVRENAEKLVEEVGVEVKGD